MKRTLVLNEDDLIMVVKEDIVKQIDENRGEMSRTEFVNYLIQCQLKEQFNNRNSVSREEFEVFTRNITETLHNCLEFFVSYGMVMGKNQKNADYQAITKQLESLFPTDDTNKEQK